MTDTAFDDEPPTDGAPDPLRPAFEAVTAALDARGKLDALKRTATDLAIPIRHGMLDRYEIEERLIDLADSHGLIVELTRGTVEIVIATALSTLALASEPANGHAAELEPPIDDWQPPADIPNTATGKPEPIAQAELVTPLQWPDEPPPRVSWVTHNLIPRGDVSSLGGDGGSGKTMAALQLSAAMARGAQDWLGHVIEPGPVVFLSGEEPEDEIRRRVGRIAARQGFNISELADLHFWFPSDFADCTLATPGPGGVMQATPLMRSIEAAIVQIRPALVVLDNVAAVFAGNQNDRVMVRTFVNLWRGIARSTGAGVLLLDHPSLSGLTTGTGRGGNMDWRNSVRSALHLKATDDREEAARGVRILECVKNNYAPLGSPTKLEWVDGVLAPEGTASPHQRRAAEADAETRFLDHLANVNRLGRDVGEKPGPNYAAAIFEKMEEPSGYTSAAFAKAMQRLFRDGKIALEPVGSPSRNKKRLVVVNGQAAP
jgi:RecA-family ATPase